MATKNVTRKIATANVHGITRGTQSVPMNAWINDEIQKFKNSRGAGANRKNRTWRKVERSVTSAGSLANINAPAAHPRVSCIDVTHELDSKYSSTSSSTFVNSTICPPTVIAAHDDLATTVPSNVKRPIPCRTGKNVPSALPQTTVHCAPFDVTKVTAKSSSVAQDALQSNSSSDAVLESKNDEQEVKHVEDLSKALANIPPVQNVLHGGASAEEKEEQKRKKVESYAIPIKANTHKFALVEEYIRTVDPTITVYRIEGMVAHCVSEGTRARLVTLAKKNCPDLGTTFDICSYYDHGAAHRSLDYNISADLFGINNYEAQENTSKICHCNFFGPSIDCPHALGCQTFFAFDILYYMHLSALCEWLPVNALVLVITHYFDASIQDYMMDWKVDLHGDHFDMTPRDGMVEAGTGYYDCANISPHNFKYHHGNYALVGHPVAKLFHCYFWKIRKVTSIMANKIRELPTPVLESVVGDGRDDRRRVAPNPPVFLPLIENSCVPVNLAHSIASTTLSDIPRDIIACAETKRILYQQYTPKQWTDILSALPYEVAKIHANMHIDLTYRERFMVGVKLFSSTLRKNNVFQMLMFAIFLVIGLSSLLSYSRNIVGFTMSPFFDYIRAAINNEIHHDTASKFELIVSDIKLHLNDIVDVRMIYGIILGIFGCCSFFVFVKMCRVLLFSISGSTIFQSCIIAPIIEEALKSNRYLRHLMIIIEFLSYVFVKYHVSTDAEFGRSIRTVAPDLYDSINGTSFAVFLVQRAVMVFIHYLMLAFDYKKRVLIHAFLNFINIYIELLDNSEILLVDFLVVITLVFNKYNIYDLMIMANYGHSGRLLTICRNIREELNYTKVYKIKRSCHYKILSDYCKPSWIYQTGPTFYRPPNAMRQCVHNVEQALIKRVFIDKGLSFEPNEEVMNDLFTVVDLLVDLYIVERDLTPVTWQEYLSGKSHRTRLRAEAGKLRLCNRGYENIRKFYEGHVKHDELFIDDPEMKFKPRLITASVVEYSAMFGPIMHAIDKILSRIPLWGKNYNFKQLNEWISNACNSESNILGGDFSTFDATQTPYHFTIFWYLCAILGMSPELLKDHAIMESGWKMKVKYGPTNKLCVTASSGFGIRCSGSPQTSVENNFIAIVCHIFVYAEYLSNRFQLPARNIIAGDVDGLSLTQLEMMHHPLIRNFASFTHFRGINNGDDWIGIYPEAFDPIVVHEMEDSYSTLGLKIELSPDVEFCRGKFLCIAPTKYVYCRDPFEFLMRFGWSTDNKFANMHEAIVRTRTMAIGCVEMCDFIPLYAVFINRILDITQGYETNPEYLSDSWTLQHLATNTRCRYCELPTSTARASFRIQFEIAEALQLSIEGKFMNMNIFDTVDVPELAGLFYTRY